MVDEFNAANFYKRLQVNRQLSGVRCNSCGHIAPEARPMCSVCHSFDVEWHSFSGKATLNTFTCISIVPEFMLKKGYGRDNPYCSGIVELAEGPRISARITGVDGNKPQNIKTGMQMVLDVEGFDSEHPSLAFRPA